MSYIEAIVYGIVQGVTEFLPISSTAHLMLIPWLFGWEEPGIAFDVALHLGTAAAVIIFFFKDWVRLIGAGFTRPKSNDGKLFWFIVIATIPGGIVGLLLDKYMNVFSKPLVIAVTLMVMGVLLYIADRASRDDIQLEKIGFKRSFLIGISQALAIIPGISRSGITMTTGRLLGVTRESAAKFTFLLATPIILADGLYHAKGLASHVLNAGPFFTAVLTAAVVGMLSIKFLLDFLKKKGFGIFAVYRVVLGIVIIIICFVRG